MYDAAASKRYRERHPQKVRAMLKSWQSRNREHIRKYEKTRRDSLPENEKKKRDEQSARWRKNNREKYLEYLRQWRAANKDRVRLLRRRNKDKRLTLPGAFTPEDIARIRTQQRGKCAYCRQKLVKEHLDHITPVKRGGDNRPSNLQLLCPPCNQRKQAKDPLRFAREIGFLL